jgi:hypothetical protein
MIKYPRIEHEMLVPVGTIARDVYLRDWCAIGWTKTPNGASLRFARIFRVEVPTYHNIHGYAARTVHELEKKFPRDLNPDLYRLTLDTMVGE